MATRPLRREEALAAINKEREAYARLLKQAEASGDKVAYQQYSDKIGQLDAQSRATGLLGEIGSGVVSAGVGLLTGIPDMVIAGYNSAARPTVPMQTLRERVLNFAQIPTEATSTEGSIAYGAPEVATAVAGLGQLGALGFQGIQSWMKTRKVDELLGKLPTEEANRFKEYMLRGQGSPNSEVAAQIAKLRGNAKYKELFNALDDAATKAATSGMAPRPSRIEEPEAARNMVSAVEERLKKVRTARSEAGNENFTKAFELGGDRAILTPSKTIDKIDELIKQTDTSSDSGKAAVKYLQETRDSIAPRINVAPRAGTQYTVDEGIRGSTVAGTPSGTRIENRVVTNYDSLGMPQTKTIQVEVPYAGSPAVTSAGKAPTMGMIPGSPGYTIQQNPKALTVQEVQARLRDWGRNAATEGSVVRDLAVSDEVRISKALFGAMKDDLSASTKAATNVADKRALGALEQARSQTSKASQDYNTLVAQGIPDFLKGKNVADVSFEQLSGAYKNLNPSQRAVFRDWVGQNKAESLQAIDRDIFQTFKAKHTGTLDDGTVGTDLKGMAEDWAKMMPKEQDALAAALGQNLNEFNGRMKDALSFTRRMNAGSLGAEEAAARGTTRELSAIVGSTPLGYQGAKITQLTGDILGGFKKGIVSDDLAMKTLLTPEGASFLKQAKLSPGSQQTLADLTKVDQASPTRLQYLMTANPVVAPVVPNQSQIGQEPDITIPDFNMPDMQAEPQQQMQQQPPTVTPQEPQIVIPNFNE
jgi:hypothetical protein